MDIMERVLKKFGKWSDGTKGTPFLESEDDTEGGQAGQGENGLVVDGWGVYLENYGGEVGIGLCFFFSFRV